MEKVRLEIVGMSYSQSQSGAYALILGEASGNRRLPIIIGGFEAQSIAVELERMKPSRPLTHDLFKSFADHYKVHINEVIIDEFKQGVFHAKLVCEQFDQETLIDARTSDAVALAIRFKCPIYTHEKILVEAGIIMDDQDLSETAVEGTPIGTKASEYDTHSLTELEDMLQEAVEQENYERASEIRDAIKRKK